MHIHCSACGAPLPQGAKFCPACALPLTAIAMPTPAPPKKQVSILAILLCAFGIFWVIAYASSHVTEAHRQEALAAFTADLQAGGKLNAPEAFQARCGKATETAQKKKETILTYRGADAIEVHFVAGKEAVFTRQIAYQHDDGSWHDGDQTISIDFALGYLPQCKGAQ